jgi:hypothetical protein
MTQLSELSKISEGSELSDFLEIEALREEQIELSEDQIEQAVHLSESITDPSQQWQLYIHALALVGFKQWLSEWAPDLEIDESHYSLFQPDQLVAVCNFSVAKFNICLIAIPIALESTVDLPKAIVDRHQFAPHFYTLIEVQEEQMQVKVRGYLRQDKLFEQQRSHPLKSISEDRYAVPITWFNPDSTDLLLELRCLKPYPITSLSPSPIINVSHWAAWLDLATAAGSCGGPALCSRRADDVGCPYSFSSARRVSGAALRCCHAAASGDYLGFICRQRCFYLDAADHFRG